MIQMHQIQVTFLTNDDIDPGDSASLVCEIIAEAVATIDLDGVVCRPVVFFTKG